MTKKDKLWAIFSRAGEPGWRYVAKATGLANGHWLVFDNKTQRFLESGAEGQIDPFERIAMEKINGE